MNYHNPHPQMPFPNPHQQRPIHGPQFPQHPQQGYPQPAQQTGYPQQIPQAQPVPYWVQQQPGYQQAPVMPPPYPQQDNNLQMINTPQGMMIIDARTGQVLGPANSMPQQPMQARGVQHVAPFQGQLMQPAQVMQAPQERGNALPDNRYGNAGSLIKPKEQPNPSNVIDAVEVPVSAPKPIARPAVKTLMTGYIPTYHNKAFTELQTCRKEAGLVGSTLESIASELIEDAHSGDEECLLWIQSGAIVQKFYKTTLIDKEQELYQTDIEKVYRAVKKVAPTINTRDDFVYFQAYNKWLTQAINTFLSIHMKATVIDSFFEDFNELIKFLIVDYDHLREQLVEHMAGVLENAMCDVKELRAVSQENPEPVINKDQSMISEHLTLVYVKLFSGEIGDDDSEAGLKVANKMIDSIKALLDKPDFILITLDRRFYRVTVMKDDDADIDCIRM